jgi:hypothetical protein
MEAAIVKTGVRIIAIQCMQSGWTASFNWQATSQIQLTPVSITIAKKRRISAVLPHVDLNLTCRSAPNQI